MLWNTSFWWVFLLRFPNFLRAVIGYELMYSTSAKYIVMQKTDFFFCVWQIPDVPEDVIWQTENQEVQYGLQTFIKTLISQRKSILLFNRLTIFDYLLICKLLVLHPVKYTFVGRLWNDICRMLFVIGIQGKLFFICVLDAKKSI